MVEEDVDGLVGGGEGVGVKVGDGLSPVTGERVVFELSPMRL
jgi:hypothetical protein